LPLGVPEPDVVRHADWSVNPQKRWAATARRVHDGYRVESICPIENVLEPPDAGQRMVVGFDFPIGLPEAYALAAGIPNFLDALQRLGTGRWAAFFEPARTPAELSLERPFYPANPRPRGTVSRHQLAQGLGVPFERLRRRCEHAYASTASEPGRRAASPIFWLVGGQQVGRAAIHGWRHVLQRALGNGRDVALWPFHGSLETLFSTHQVTIVEAYPGEFKGHLGLGRTRWSKRSSHDRAARGAELLGWARRHCVDIERELANWVLEGCGPGPGGEDPFDALIGVLGMINVVTGQRSAGPGKLASPSTAIEGWILGQLRSSDPSTQLPRSSARRRAHSSEVIA